MFDLARIAASGLVAEIDFHESLGSTSDRALALGAQGEVELPLLVLATRQTAGRGRGSNRWWSADGALTFSLVLKAPPDRLPAQRWPQVALVAGIAVCEALEAFALRADLAVKWPNDVYLSGSKICGILSESVPGWRDRLVVGIGINVNNRGQESGVRSQEPGARSDCGGPLANHPALPFSAASLIEQDGVPRDLTEVLLSVLDEFDRRWQELLDGQFEAAANVYRERCFLTNKTVTIEQPGGQRVVGVCRGIDDSGGLRVQTERGEETVVSGAVVGWDD
ncbi:MAG TPA: biotin--[acetyl-CoA-carboxylase] ligase [Pirellulaceae bacterium]|nr:biotin--[acetyl-CoA-carboxylase] ligase [Pirellulaceae bacterium]